MGKNKNTGFSNDSQPLSFQYSDFILACYILPDSTEQDHNHFFTYNYLSNTKAKEQLELLKRLFTNNNLSTKGLSISTKVEDEKNIYQIRVSHEQHKVIQDLKSSNILIKTLRWDEYCFFDDFVNDLTHYRDKVESPRKKPRHHNHKPYTVFASGAYDRSDKPSPYPEERIAEKKYFSLPQSTSLIVKGEKMPVFGWGKRVLAGVIMSPEDALINRMFLYDAGTTERPYEFSTKRKAEAYHRTVANKTLFDDMESFIEAIMNRELNSYNEVLARLRWNYHKSSVGFFSDDFESRCVAQILKERVAIKLKQREQEGGQSWPEGYDIPIIFETPSEDKHRRAYTLEEQLKDRERANDILEADIEREQFFEKKQFAFLLLVDDKEKANNINYHGKNIRLTLYDQKLFHIAEYLLDSKEKMIEEVLSLDKTISQKYIAYLLQKSLFSKDFQLWKHLIDKIEDVNTTVDDKGRTLLFHAATYGHIGIVKELLAKGADPDKADNNGYVALHMAVDFKHLEVIELLVQSGAKLNIKAEEGVTPVYLACLQGCDTGLDILLANGATGIDERVGGILPTSVAAIKGHYEVIETILNHIDLNQLKKQGSEMLCDAIIKDHAEIFNLLIQSGVNVNKVVIPGLMPYIPLHDAISHERTNFVKILLDKGADPEEVYKECETVTPLEMAAKKGNKKIIYLLNKAIYTKHLREPILHYKFSLFGRDYEIGEDITQKKNALCALTDLENGESDIDTLKIHQDILNNSNLKNVFDSFIDAYQDDYPELATLNNTHSARL